MIKKFILHYFTSKIIAGLQAKFFLKKSPRYKQDSFIELLENARCGCFRQELFKP